MTTTPGVVTTEEKEERVPRVEKDPRVVKEEKDRRDLIHGVDTTKTTMMITTHGVDTTVLIQKKTVTKSVMITADPRAVKVEREEKGTTVEKVEREEKEEKVITVTKDVNGSVNQVTPSTVVTCKRISLFRLYC